MKVRSVQRGRAPNCSSAGSLVGAALVSAVAGAAVFNAFASSFAEWIEGRGPPGGPEGAPGSAAPRLRQEADGGILAWDSGAGPALLTLDPAAAEASVRAGARVVGGDDDGALDVPGALRAPTEAHLTVTTRCPVACTACYLDAGPSRGADMDAASLERDLDALADMGVFEVAFGGGEAGLRADVLALAARARARGMVPNLTTSGFGLTDPERAAAFAEAFGQVNVSIDGIGDAYAGTRGWDGASVGLAALRALAEAGARVGVNTVLTRANVGGLGEMADVLMEAGAREWQWLRLKPAGRGASAYDALCLRPEEAAALWPTALAIEARSGAAGRGGPAERRGLPIRFDCALVPFLTMHGPDPDVLARLGVRGCVGGHSLWARTPEGAWAPCSFASSGAPSDGGSDLRRRWADDPVARAWRGRAEAPPAPCDTCAYRQVCRGGCRIVAGHLLGDALAPDPECPRVRAHAAGSAA